MAKTRGFLNPNAYGRININGNTKTPIPSSLPKTKTSTKVIPKESPRKSRSILNSFFRRIVLALILLDASERLAIIRSEIRNNNTTKS